MELKPCPFCGGDARMVVLTSYPPKYQVEHACEVVCAKPAETPEQAIKAWNTRAERTGRIKEDETGFLVCSECGAIQPEEWTVYYCWSCGAKVVEE